MRVHASVTLIGKVAKPWKDSEGVERVSYSCHIMQNEGEIVETIRITQAQYNVLIAGKPYLITADYGVGKNGGYLRIVNIEETK